MALTSNRHPSQRRRESIDRLFARPLTPNTRRVYNEKIFYPTSKPDRFQDVFLSRSCLRCYSSQHVGTDCNMFTKPCPRICKHWRYLYHPTSDCPYKNGLSRANNRSRSSSRSRPLSKERPYVKKDWHNGQATCLLAHPTEYGLPSDTSLSQLTEVASFSPENSDSLHLGSYPSPSDYPHDFDTQDYFLDDDYHFPVTFD